MSQDAKKYQRLVNRFVALANNMQDEGLDPNMVSDAMMFASGTYATFTLAGNDGGLTEPGVEKVVDRYRMRLVQVQASKKIAYGEKVGAASAEGDKDETQH